MGKKQDLTSSEKDEIIRLLGKGIPTLQIAKDVKRNHRKLLGYHQKNCLCGKQAVSFKGQSVDSYCQCC